MAKPVKQLKIVCMFDDIYLGKLLTIAPDVGWSRRSGKDLINQSVS